MNLGLFKVLFQDVARKIMEISRNFPTSTKNPDIRTFPKPKEMVNVQCINSFVFLARSLSTKWSASRRPWPACSPARRSMSGSTSPSAAGGRRRGGMNFWFIAQNVWLINLLINVLMTVSAIVQKMAAEIRSFSAKMLRMCSKIIELIFRITINNLSNPWIYVWGSGLKIVLGNSENSRQSFRRNII